MYPPITYELLESKNACTYQLELVKEHFGLEPIPLTESVVEQFGVLFDIEWAAENLLTDVDYDKWIATSELTVSSYQSFIDASQLEYDQTMAESFSYARDHDPTYSTHISVSQSAWNKFREIRDHYRSIYKRLMSREFIRLYGI